MIEFELTGFERAFRILRGLQKAKGRAIWKKCVAAGCKAMLKSIKIGTPKDSGMLFKSLGVKVKAKRNGSIYGVVGPRRKQMKMWKGGKRVPSRYAHLVEGGRRAKVVKMLSKKGKPFERVVTAVAANKFIARGVAHARDEVTKAMRDTLQAEFDKLCQQT